MANSSAIELFNQSEVCRRAASMMVNLTRHDAFGCPARPSTRGPDVPDLHARIDTFNPASQLYFIGYPFLLAIGLIGNTLLPVFLWKTQPRTTYLAYMTAICVSNSLVLLFEFPGYIATYVTSMHSNRDLRDFMLYSLGIQMFGEDTFTQISNWTVVAFSVERLIVIWRPLQFQARRRQRFALIVMAVIAVLAVALSLPATVIYYKMGQRMGFFQHEMDHCPGMLSMAQNIQRIAQILILVEGVIVSVVVPVITFLILMTTSFLLILLLTRHRLHRKNVLQKGQALPPDTVSALSNPTACLLRAVAAYFLTQIPYAVYMLLLTLSMPPKCQGLVSMSAEKKVSPVIQFIFLAYYALTFLIHNNLLTEIGEYIRRRLKARKKHSQAEALVTPGTSSTSL
ncbi:uncharacterized protein LOC129582330 [Paramacrobiotus metropolitanus]|uniref:uncharacterized protein LOC129582330 n=1 Tax=Paramacrobiotus metropolitanus TaxID=2943436 RepID=UPI002445DC12|nr:uncharacterized protein LOC129582330 [Paramacrobiotus metropolitanus]XP_055329816.1 uncharacterized protein LOC129582330 [Paramacrobiotus metropolitanus]